MELLNVNSSIVDCHKYIKHEINIQQQNCTKLEQTLNNPCISVWCISLHLLSYQMYPCCLDDMDDVHHHPRLIIHILSVQIYFSFRYCYISCCQNRARSPFSGTFREIQAIVDPPAESLLRLRMQTPEQVRSPVVILQCLFLITETHSLKYSCEMSSWHFCFQISNKIHYNWYFCVGNRFG